MVYKMTLALSCVRLRATENIALDRGVLMSTLRDSKMKAFSAM